MGVEDPHERIAHLNLQQPREKSALIYNLKYLNYIVRILERYKQTAKHIRMIVIYTADIEQAEEEFHAGCLSLRLEQAYLRKIDSKSIRD